MGNSEILNVHKKDTSDDKQRNAEKKLKVGIIGTGWIAEYHLIA